MHVNVNISNSFLLLFLVGFCLFLKLLCSFDGGGDECMIGGGDLGDAGIDKYGSDLDE